jgi:PKD repeat protein
LNIPLTPGSYRIGGTQMNLYRNSSGASFPYPMNGVASITGSSAAGRYYYLYNWTIQPQCITNRNPVPVTLALQNQALFTYTNVANTYNFTSTGIQATQWWWNFGDGSPVVTTQNPQHTFLAPSGPYTVQLIVSDGTCYDSSLQVVNVINGFTELSGSISGIYPNPATNELHITSQALAQNYEVEIYDIVGQKVFTAKSEPAGKTETLIDIAALRPGVYSIEILSGGNKSSGRFIKQ